MDCRQSCRRRSSGSRKEEISRATARFMAVGKLSLELWVLFKWSFGCTLLSPIVPPRIWIARLEITSFTFIFVWVPEPVAR